MRVINPKVVASKEHQLFTHWIEMKVMLRRHQKELVQRKVQLRTKLSKMLID